MALGDNVMRVRRRGVFVVAVHDRVGSWPGGKSLPCFDIDFRINIASGHEFLGRFTPGSHMIQIRLMTAFGRKRQFQKMAPMTGSGNNRTKIAKYLYVLESGAEFLLNRVNVRCD